LEMHLSNDDKPSRRCEMPLVVRTHWSPGIDNYDMALRKVTRVTEAASLEFRFETFNTFNHAQFDGANAVDGNINDSTFGQILKSQPGRVCQLALKFNF
jgi:hypothetical protein